MQRQRPGVQRAPTSPVNQVNFGHIKPYDYFDLSARVSVMENLSLTLTVQNIGNRKPPIVGIDHRFDVVQQRQHLPVDLRRAGSPLRRHRPRQVLVAGTSTTEGAGLRLRPFSLAALSYSGPPGVQRCGRPPCFPPGGEGRVRNDGAGVTFA